MDIALPAIDTRVNADAGVKMPVTLPNGTTYMQEDGKTPVSLTLLGADSQVYRDASMTLARKRLERGQNQGTFDERVAEAEADAIGLLVAATINWDGINDSKGKLVPVSPEAVRFLFVKFPAIRDQAEAFINTRANFTPRS